MIPWARSRLSKGREEISVEVRTKRQDSHLWVSQEIEETPCGALEVSREPRDGHRHTHRHSEVERVAGEPSSLEKGDEERTEAAVDVQAEVMLHGQLSEGGDVVDSA